MALNLSLLLPTVIAPTAIAPAATTTAATAVAPSVGIPGPAVVGPAGRLVPRVGEAPRLARAQAREAPPAAGGLAVSLVRALGSTLVAREKAAAEQEPALVEGLSGRRRTQGEGASSGGAAVTSRNRGGVRGSERTGRRSLLVALVDGGNAD